MKRHPTRIALLMCCLSSLFLITTDSVSGGKFPLEQWDSWSQQSTDRIPHKQWLRYASPEEAGWSSEKLALAKTTFDKLESAALLVIHDGAVLVAWGDSETRFMCHSMRKSLLSALYGIHASKGTIDLNKTLAELDINDEPTLTDGERRARIIDLLTARSGVYHPAAYETAKMKKQRPPRGSREPGEIFWYNNWDFNALCTIFEQETGTAIFEEFERQFAIPLDMQDFRVTDNYYHLEPNHSQHPAYPFRMSARDLARLGLLFLRNGRWGDKQVLSQKWVKDSTASTFQPVDATDSTNYAYGYLWWPVVKGPLKDMHIYSARGYGGHAIDVVPRANLVVIHRVNTFWNLALPLELEQKRVETSDRFALLQQILEAREAAPKSHARLTPLPVTRKTPKPFALTRQMRARLVGDYRFDGFSLTVSVVDDELFVGTPRIGKFKLVASSPTHFTIEDLRAPLEFELSEEGEPVGVVAEFVPGRKLTGQPRVLTQTTGQ